jgi:hypothetical protein
MSITNGSKAQPSRDQIIQQATYYATVYGYYDTSEAAQLANLLTITLLDMAGYEALPPDATHRFYVCINATAYFVTRYPDHYEVQPHDRLENQRIERELRQAVLDVALWHFTGEGADAYRPGGEAGERDRLIENLLSEGAEEEQGDSGKLKHPVVRDEVPDMSIAGPGEGSTIAERQWSVAIGDYYCEIGLFGVSEDGSPNLVVLDGESE